MEESNFEQENAPESSLKTRFTTVTTLSKYLALLLFITLPFIGGWIGYKYSPNKVVKVEKVEVQEMEKVQVIMGVTERIESNVFYITDRISHSKSLFKSNGLSPNLEPPSEDEEQKIYLINQDNRLVGALPVEVKVLSSGGSHMPEWRPVDIWHDGGMDVVQYPPNSGTYRYLVLHTKDTWCDSFRPGKMCLETLIFDDYRFDEEKNVLVLAVGPNEGSVNEHVEIIEAYISDFSFEIINHVPGDWK